MRYGPRSKTVRMELEQWNQSGSCHFSVCNIARVFSGARITVAVKCATSPTQEQEMDPGRKKSIRFSRPNPDRDGRHDSVVADYDGPLGSDSLNGVGQRATPSMTL